jgi:copper chaperone CopZ
MKEIKLDTLEAGSRRSSMNMVKKSLAALVAVLVLCGGGYAAYQLVTGDVAASRLVVAKMNCPACVITVKEVTGKIPGVIESDISLAAQEVQVKYREKQTNPDRIKEALNQAGYPTAVDGVFSPELEGSGGKVVAGVNGRPVFAKDLKLPLELKPEKSDDENFASSLFNVIGARIVLGDADSKVVVVQPADVVDEVSRLQKQWGLSDEEMDAVVTKSYGSPMKFYQLTAQVIGMRMLVNDHVAYGVDDPKEREEKTLRWLASLFDQAQVTIVSEDIKRRLEEASGHSDWKKLWPLMISKDTELKRVLVRREL